jgi:hypothetical protein
MTMLAVEAVPVTGVGACVSAHPRAGNDTTHRMGLLRRANRNPIFGTELSKLDEPLPKFLDDDIRGLVHGRRDPTRSVPPRRCTRSLLPPASCVARNTLTCSAHWYERRGNRDGDRQGDADHDDDDGELDQHETVLLPGAS